MNKKFIRRKNLIDRFGNSYSRIQTLLICNLCGEDFWGSFCNQKFCSNQCRDLNHKKKKKKSV